jgi:hypothetical protein
VSGPDQEFLGEPFDLVGFAFRHLELDEGGYDKQRAVATSALFKGREAEVLKLGLKIDRARWRPTRWDRYVRNREQTHQATVCNDMSPPR